MFNQRTQSSVKPYVVHLTALTIIFELLGSARAEGAATADWQKESRKAYNSVHVDKNSSKASQEYQRARSMCKLPESHPIALDLDLARVDTLLRMNRVDQAQPILQQLWPVIERLHRGKLIEARYWRRSRDLHAHQMTYYLAARDQRHVVDLISKLLGEDCTDAMDERMTLLHLLAQGNEWNTFFDVLKECDRIMSTRPREQQTARINAEMDSYLVWFVYRFQQVLSKSPSTAIKLVDRFEELRPRDRRVLSLLIKLPHSQSNSELCKRIVSTVHANKWTDNEANLKVAQIEVGKNAPNAFGVSVPSKQMLAEIDEAYMLAQKVAPPSTRQNYDLYIQALALKASMLAKTGYLDKADALIDSLHSSLPVPRLLGILQARREIAKEALALKQTALAEKQFEAILKLLTERTRGEERAAYINQWTTQRRLYLGH